MTLESDPRFIRALTSLRERDFDAAGDALEELFFEAVTDEVAVVRALMQLSVGCLHAERGQRSAAAGRLAEALKAIDAVTNPHGIEFQPLRGEVQRLLDQVRAGLKPEWPVVRRLEDA